MSTSKDPAADQLPIIGRTPEATKPQNLTDHNGAPIGDKTNSITVGPRGPILIQDKVLIEELASFDRERIAERVVHAKGGGAFGYFEVTSSVITQYTKAALFSEVGKKTPVALRFSTVGGESGSADTARDPRGFAMKFYTEEGNWDLVGNNTPIFFLRDPILFPSFIHTQKRNPQTHLKDPNMFWDFISLRPETTHQVCFLFSDRGTPDGFRHMNGYGSHTFKLVDKANKAVYCKFHLKTAQGIKNLPVDKAHQISADDPDYSLKDLYNAIATGNFPKWRLFIQVMTYEQAEKSPFNPFDVTKVWPQKEFPLIKVGELVLDRNQTNYFAEIEQLAFSPSNFVPGIEASPDKMLQGRLFSYEDTHRHRLGPNFMQIPVNKPICPYAFPTRRDGQANSTDNDRGLPNYFPNSFMNLKTDRKYLDHVDNVSGDVTRHDNGDDDNFSQVTIFWTRVLNGEERERLVANIAGHLKNAAPFIQERAVGNFAKVHADFGDRLRTALARLTKV